MAMSELRKRIDTEEFDSLLLLDALKEYSNPRDKVFKLLKSGEIILVKRGLYIFGEPWRRGPVCIECLANQVYGPSYISLEYALAYHGLIPERVTWITSVTTKRTKEFETPIANFSYLHLNIQRYTIGANIVPIDKLHSVQMASPEKALSDHLARQRDIRSFRGLKEHIYDSMRIEESALASLDVNLIAEIAAVYSSLQVRLLAKLVGGGDA